MKSMDMVTDYQVMVFGWPGLYVALPSTWHYSFTPGILKDIEWFEEPALQ